MATLIEMRDGSTVTDSRLGRLRQFDERSRSFAVSDHPRLAAAPIKTTIWKPFPSLNQLTDGTCVGHGFEAEAGATPVPTQASHTHALLWFDKATAIDGIAGVSRADGTSVLAGAKVGVALKFFAAYRWAFTAEEVIRAVVGEGPVVVGSDWLSGMWNPDPDGRLHVEGSVEGGHCWLIYGFVLKGDLNPFNGLPAVENTFLMQNSWGASWGRLGRAWLYESDFDKLRLAGGEVCVPINRFDPYAVPAPKPVIKKKWVWSRFHGWVRSLGATHAA